MNHFARNIRPYVDAELVRAREARLRNDVSEEFSRLENAHVLGQSSTWHHVRVHGRMLAWSLRQHDFKEGLGQLMRIAAAATKTMFGWVPEGNTGGARVSPFQPMPIQPRLAKAIERARSGKPADNT